MKTNDKETIKPLRLDNGFTLIELPALSKAKDRAVGRGLIERGGRGLSQTPSIRDLNF